MQVQDRTSGVTGPRNPVIDRLPSVIERLPMAATSPTPERGSSPPRSSCSPSAATAAPRSARSRPRPGWRRAPAASTSTSPARRSCSRRRCRERIAEIDAFNARLELEPLGDLRAELTLVASWGLAELARERDLIRIVMRDGGRVPELAERFHATVVRRGIELATGRSSATRPSAGSRSPTPQALGEVVCASLVGFSLQQMMFGERLRRGRRRALRRGLGRFVRRDHRRTSKGAKSMPDPCSTPTRHRTAIRAALARRRPDPGRRRPLRAARAELVLRGLPARPRLGRGAARLQRAPGARRRRPLPRHRGRAARRRVDARSGGW